MTGCTAEQAQDAMDVKLTATTLYCHQGHFSEASYEPLRVRLKAGAMPMTHTVPVLTAEEVRQLSRCPQTHSARTVPATARALSRARTVCLLKACFPIPEPRRWSEQPGMPRWWPDQQELGATIVLH
jgi:hypothetical protein